ncbi:hypothetical protein EXIGLDRAFT_764092 [Exidia glandulosa HHB12029]|uniref:Uncharacterized protein n=1 Tax=Exidia glandulosa HHB12029 TaxID=1314781 RepID=A0A165LDR9_EXIGL|nr:hypothetical protein EXIGLDRAFT_764092 [Exidia glandulosa HHB12029]
MALLLGDDMPPQLVAEIPKKSPNNSAMASSIKGAHCRPSEGIMQPAYPGNRQPARRYANVAAHRTAYWLGAEPVAPLLFDGDPAAANGRYDQAQDYYRANALLPRYADGPGYPPPYDFQPQGPAAPYPNFPFVPLYAPAQLGNNQQAQPGPLAGFAPNNYTQQVPAANVGDAVNMANIGPPRPRPQPIGDQIMDRIQAGQALVVYSIDMFFQVLHANGPRRERLTIKSDTDPEWVRKQVCEKMRLDPLTADLGFKTSRDKARDAPWAFNSKEQVLEAIACICQAKSRARTRENDLFIKTWYVFRTLIVLTAALTPSQAQPNPGYPTPGGSVKRGKAQSTALRVGGIATTTSKMLELEDKLRCQNKTCNTPGKAGVDKFCCIDRDGTHVWVCPEVRSFWASCMAADPENVTVNHPPATLKFDHVRSKKRRLTLLPLSQTSRSYQRQLRQAPPRFGREHRSH